MKTDKSPDPVNVCLFRTVAVLAYADGFTNAIQQRRLRNNVLGLLILKTIRCAENAMIFKQFRVNDTLYSYTVSSRLFSIFADCASALLLPIRSYVAMKS